MLWIATTASKLAVGGEVSVWAEYGMLEYARVRMDGGVRRSLGKVGRLGEEKSGSSNDEDSFALFHREEATAPMSSGSTFFFRVFSTF